MDARRSSVVCGAIENRLIPMNLAFFNQPAQEKTEKATPKKRKKAREEGQVAQSQEISTAVLFVAAFVALRAFIPGMFDRIIGMITFNFAVMSNINDVAVSGYLARHIAWTLGQIIWTILPLALVIVALGLLVSIMQVGWKPTLKTLKPKFSKLSPLKGIKKVFSMKIFMELFKTTIKFAVILAVVYFVLVGELDALMELFYLDLIAAMILVGNLIVTVAVTVGILYIFVAGLDYAFNRWKHEKELRMTKQEVKEEYKQTEGDPLVKSRIRQKMREASMRRMMQEVPTADVVITNPLHFACAIRYDRLSVRAPILVAKGADHMAQRIRDTAMEHEVMIMEDKPLARTLYATVEVGQEIPAELWQAVAEVLAYVYSLKGNQPAMT